MGTLARELRKELERAVRDARRIAEEGARRALEQLAVHHHEPWTTLSPDQRQLRNRLRAHGRQLGDKRNEQRGTQDIARLTQECAYEHWHRMLFARFLAENDLLIEPNHSVAISLGECQELARSQNEDWVVLASSFAVRMLPQIFRQGDPVLEVALPPETRSKLEDLLKELPRDLFLADDSLGWVYQFWQADQKLRINDSEKKIGADELPAVTQFFTDDYMVLFLLHNTLGAWWAGKVLDQNPELARSAKSEDELRAACSIGGIDWTYLRFIRDKAEDAAEGPWRPAAGKFEVWPKAAKEITLLDPCMGSGHFLVFAMPILVALRMAEESLSREQAVEAVLRDNLFGLEIDQRCTQIAAFNLAFAAWRMIGYRQLPPMNLACSGLAPGVSKGEWMKLAERIATTSGVPPERNLFGSRDNLFSRRIKDGIARLHDLFAKAPLLGSLVDPRTQETPLIEASFTELQPLLSSLLAHQRSDDMAEMAVSAYGMARSAEILTGHFVLIATNVPYLATRRQSSDLQDFCTRLYPSSKNDLATILLQRCIRLVTPGGTVAAVLSQYWLFKSTYESVRRNLLKVLQWNMLARLGTAAFETISGEVVNVCAGIWTDAKPSQDHVFLGSDFSSARSPVAKALSLRSQTFQAISQFRQLSNPLTRIIFEIVPDGQTLSDLAIAPQGVKTGDDERWRRRFWEIPAGTPGWLLYQSTVRQHTSFGGRHLILDWRTNGAGMIRPRVNNLAVGKKGVAISQSGGLAATIYTGERFDSNVAPIVPLDQDLLPALWAYCTSDDYRENVRKIDQSLKVTNIPLLQVPFDKKKWSTKAKEQGGLPQERSDDPTQWPFHGNPRHSSAPLQVAVSRLLSYRWPAEELKRDLAPEAQELLLKASSIGTQSGDGIISLSPLIANSSATDQLLAVLAQSFGDYWSAATLSSLLSAAGCPDSTLEAWLRDSFFVQHCDLFSQRPFIWHIWDGRSDGFNVFVNYHRLAAPNGDGRRTLEKLIYTYLGGWIELQRDGRKNEVDGADARLASAEHLKQELEKIFAGEPPYDIFVRWKPLHEQPIGWEPDINDGMRVNIRPFIVARTFQNRGTGSSILKTAPRINWDKDQGKEADRNREDFPWFWGWDGKAEDFAGGKSFDGNRWNNLHYTNKFKQAAREQHSAPRAKAAR